MVKPEFKKRIKSKINFKNLRKKSKNNPKILNN